jgi:PTH1 family peptidyl-tRNA hydrolase
MESIVQHLGTEAFPRLRVGIGREGGPRDRDYVLSPFDPSEREAAAAAVEKGADAVEVWLREDIERCMNAFNARPRAKDSEDGKEESV